MDWLNNLTELRSRYEADVAQVRGNGDLTEKAKAERIKELTQKFEDSYIKEKREVEATLERTERQLYKKAHAREEGTGDVQADLLREMRQQRVERDLLDVWEQRGDGPTLEEYELAVLRGDEDELAAYERLGPRRIKDAWQRQAFAERAEEGRQERMPQEKRRAIEELKEFEEERGKLGYALAVRDNTAKVMSSGNLQSTHDTEDGRNRRRIRG